MVAGEILISIIIFSHCFWEKCTSWIEFFTCLTPFISLTASLKLTWLQFSHYLTCIRWAQFPSHCACPSVPVLWTSNVAYSSSVFELLGDLVLMMAAWYAQYLILLCKLSDQACDFRTSDHPSYECGRISSHTKCSTISLDDCVRLLKCLVNNYWWELSPPFKHNNISVQNAWAIWG